MQLSIALSIAATATILTATAATAHHPGGCHRNCGGGTDVVSTGETLSADTKPAAVETGISPSSSTTVPSYGAGASAAASLAQPTPADQWCRISRSMPRAQCTLFNGQVAGIGAIKTIERGHITFQFTVSGKSVSGRFKDGKTTGLPKYLKPRDYQAVSGVVQYMAQIFNK